MRHPTTWVTTFDGAASRVFVLHGEEGRLVEIEDERRDGPHKPEFDERAGRVHESMGASRSGMSSHTDPERRMEDDFVRAHAAHLAEMAKTRAFQALIVAAGPRALGAFRKAAPKALADVVTREISGDYVNGDPAQLYAARTQ